MKDNRDYFCTINIILLLLLYYFCDVSLFHEASAQCLSLSPLNSSVSGPFHLKSVGLPIFLQFLPSRKQSLPARSAQGITREGKRNLFLPDYNLTVFHSLNSQIQPGRAFLFLFSSLLG